MNSFPKIPWPTNLKIALATMPWAQATEPSLAMGNMHATLAKAGHEPVSFSFHLEFLNYLCKDSADKEQLLQFQLMSTNAGIGDWIFAVPPFCEQDHENDKKYLSGFLKIGMKADESVEYAMEARKYARSFLEKCAREILEENPAYVILFPFSSEFVPTIALSLVLNELSPGIDIGFVGASCEGHFGETLLRMYPFLRFAAGTDGDIVIPKELNKHQEQTLFFVDTRLGQPSERHDVSIISFKNDSKRELQSKPNTNSALIPFYDEYFERLQNSEISGQISRMLWIPFETSRGCWWAEKSVCTFCALTSATPKYRLQKSASSAVEELKELSSKHVQLQFHLMDWIQPKGRQDEELFRHLDESRIDIKLYLQARPSISFNALKHLAKINAEVQLGIESLSSRTLRRMKKGTTGFQCIRLLRWCAELGVKVNWNYIYNYPNCEANEYDSVRKIARSLFHLAPPSIHKFKLKRLSPIFDKYRLERCASLTPAKWYELIYRNFEPDQLFDIADDFICDETYLERDAILAQNNLLKTLHDWTNSYTLNQRRLTYRLGENFMLINDYRTSYDSSIYTFNEKEKYIYEACFDGAAPKNICEVLAQTQTPFSESEVRCFLDQLVDNGIMYEENGRYLSLAVRESGNAQR